MALQKRREERASHDSSSQFRDRQDCLSGLVPRLSRTITLNISMDLPTWLKVKMIRKHSQRLSGLRVEKD